MTIESVARPTIGPYLIDDWMTTDDWADLYLRMSQNKDEGIDRQYNETTEWAAKQGIRIRRVITDNDRSATKDNVVREGFEAVLADARGRRLVEGALTFTTVICWHSDRFARRVKDLLRVEDAGVLIKGKNSGYFDLSTPAGVATAVTVTAWAEYEGKQKALRQRAAHKQRAEAGRPFWTSHRPFGLTRHGDLVLAEVEVLREVYRRIIAGSSLRACTLWLNEHGHKTTRGGRWQDGPLRVVLLNARNCGILVYKGKEIGKGNWEAIVDEETFRAAEMILTDPARRKNAHTVQLGRGGRVSLMPGFATCGKCGDTVTVAHRKAAAGDTYRIYRCRQGHVSGRADSIDQYARALIVTRFERDDVNDRLSGKEAVDVEPLRAELARLNTKAESYRMMLDNDDMSYEDFADLNRRNRQRIKEVEKEIRQASVDNRLVGLLEVADLGHHWDHVLNIQEKHEITRAFFDKIVIQPRGQAEGRFRDANVEYWIAGETEPRIP